MTFTGLGFFIRVGYFLSNSLLTAASLKNHQLLPYPNFAEYYLARNQLPKGIFEAQHRQQYHF